MRSLKATLISLLFISMVAVAFFCLSAYRAPELAQSSSPVMAEEANIADLLSATNTERTKAGVPPLSLSENLNKSASDKCNDMALKGYWSHVDPAGNRPRHFVERYQNFTNVGENLSKDNQTSAQVVSAFMASSSHREALLNTAYTSVGFGVCEFVDGTTSVVQHLGG